MISDIDGMTSSKEIAVHLARQHSHVIRDIKKIIALSYSTDAQCHEFKEIHDTRGLTQEILLDKAFTEMLTSDLVMLKRKIAATKAADDVIARVAADIPDDTPSIPIACPVNCTKDTGGVYIITDDIYHKIGISQDVDRRIKDLQTGNARKLSVVLYSKVSKSSALEAFLHATFAKQRKQGEWFELSPADIQLARETISKLAVV